MIGNIADMMKQVQRMQGEAEKLQAELEEKEVEGSAGGGMVNVRVNGKLQVLDVRIEEVAVDPRDVSMLQDLVKAATNDALTKARDLLKDEFSKLTGGISIPGMS